MPIKNTSTNSPICSVCIQTYQHASFIKECLESVLMQQTDFSFEILIGEDGSTDGTREICIEYANRYPDIIRLSLNDRKNVIYIDGQPTGRWNVFNNIINARGKYISLLAGDDYWTDPSKIQRQIEVFLENPKCSLVFHNAIIDGGKDHGEIFTCNLSEGFYDIENVILKPWFVPTQSIIFRRDLLELDEWLKHVYNFDWSIQLMMASKFPFYYIDRTMSAYRVHDGGISRNRGTLFHPIKHIETLSIFNCISGFKFDHLIKKRLDDIRSDILSSAPNEISRLNIQKMRYWEKLLTYRCYSNAVSSLFNKAKKIFSAG